MHRFKTGLILYFILWPWAILSSEPLEIVTWGGEYEKAQAEVFFKPFEQQKGTNIVTRINPNDVEELKSLLSTTKWDVLDLTEPQAIAACEAGLLVDLSFASLVEPVDGVPLAKDFADTAIRRCSIPQNVYAAVIAYHDEAFPGIKPARAGDFFNLERFPGKRGLQKSPDAVLEWALLAEGAPPSQIHDLLSTDRGLRLAFHKLDQIRDQIVWWEQPHEPVELLKSGEVAMVSGYNGRFFQAAHFDDLPITIIWDGKVLGHAVWAINARSDRLEDAKGFISFAMNPSRMARFAERIPYGPARWTARTRIGRHRQFGIPMRDHLPNYAHDDVRTLKEDSEWIAHTQNLRDRRFNAWLRGDVY